jgi:hypothetical protein
MNHHHRRGARASALLLCTATAFTIACFNDGFSNEGTLTTGQGRLQLVIEPNRTPVEGTHFLLDTTTGDLWHLKLKDKPQWQKITKGPADLQKLKMKQLLEEPTQD